MVLARRAIELLAARECPTIVTVSQNAPTVWRQEVDEPFEQALERWREMGVRCYQPLDFDAPIASGSFRVSGMLVLPCSVGAVGAIAAGLSTNLLQRAADCAIKEGRRLVLVPRESPLSAIHLENLLKLARLGVRIVLPVPAFYTRPRTLDDVVDQIVGRALDALGVPDALDTRFVYRGDGRGEG
jgi:4-hydroxy-3-polyprenylbenzoate decarboxylase